jgi:hypothetical protein
MRASTVGPAILYPFQMQNRKDGAVPRGVQKLVRVPTRRQRARFRLAITNDATRHQIRIVENRPMGMHQRIS